MAALDEARRRLAELRMTPPALKRHGIAVNEDGVARNAAELLAYPGVDLARLAAVWPELGSLSPEIAEQLEIDARYAGYLERQERDIAVVPARRGAAASRRPRLFGGRQPVARNQRQARRGAPRHPGRRRADLRRHAGGAGRVAEAREASRPAVADGGHPP